MTDHPSCRHPLWQQEGCSNTLKALSRVRALNYCRNMVVQHGGPNRRWPVPSVDTKDFFFQSHFRQLYINKNITMPISWGCEVEPASCYWRVAWSIPLVCMAKCPWARYWTPNCSWCAGQHFNGSHHHPCMYVWITVSRSGQKRLLNDLNVMLLHFCP